MRWHASTMLKLVLRLFVSVVASAGSAATVTVTWTDSMTLAAPPPPGTCACVSANFPVRDVFSGDPFPNGSSATFQNACEVDIQLFQVSDTDRDSLSIEVGRPAPGRRYALTIVKSGDTAVTDLSSVADGGAVVVNCPDVHKRPPGSMWGPPRVR